MKMAHIRNCELSNCGYNMQGHCHALAITVGGPGDHQCDTFFSHPEKGGNPSAIGMVGACKVTSCTHNTALECSADKISVGKCGFDADCMAYRAR